MMMLAWLLIVGFITALGVLAEPICDVTGQLYNDCVVCQATCLDPKPACNGTCAPGCMCPPETPVVIEGPDGKRCGEQAECYSGVTEAMVFSAYSSAQDCTVYMLGMVVPFTSSYPKPNPNHYNPINSRFTCPYDGYYEFSLTMSGVSGGLGVAIVRDGEVVSPLAYTTDNGAISTSTITLCSQGQHVYAQVKLLYGIGLMSCTVDGMSLNSFSGKLIATV